MAEQAPHRSSEFPIVGIGASAGGLEAFLELLRALPPKIGMAFVLVQHLDPRHESRLPGLLAKATAMPVLEASDGMAVAPDHIYVITPDAALTLAADSVLKVEPRGKEEMPHLPVDRFLRSLAAHRSGGGAIGVVLSGTGSDGTLGLEDVKAAGGIAIAQDEASARFSGMPLSAVHAGVVDLVLPPARIAAELARLQGHPYLAGRAAADAGTLAPEDDDGFRAILALLREATGVDFSAYRDTTIRRRIARRVLLGGADNLRNYSDTLRSDRTELDALYQDILINVTRFFREPDVFDALAHQVFPAIVATHTDDAPIRIWVPGCSTGQEPYSLAMALLEFLDTQARRPPIQIFATDLSESVALQRARNGLYPKGIEAEVSPARLRRFFQPEDHQWRVNKQLREIVVFARQNVAADPPFSRVDLISCRNLLIYLGADWQKRVIQTFHYALNPGGFLVLGASEAIGSHGDLFGVVDQAHRIYVRKSSSAARAYLPFRADEMKPHAAADRGAPLRPRAGPADWQREADRVAADLYEPPGVLVNENFDILQFRGQTGPYLAPAAGEPSNNLLKMAREGLFTAARAAVIECQRSDAPVRHADVRIRGQDADRTLDLHVVPIRLPLMGERCYLLLFEDHTARAPAAAPAREPTPSAATTVDADQLRRELTSTRDYLQSLVEQRDAANEELKAANEEILSSNEELQSTNEELQTAKEELQSVNEELTTVNEQLQHRNAELARLHDDLVNLMGSSGMLTVVLGVDCRIRRFTSAAGKLLGLLPGDIGRPVGQLKTAISLPDLDALVADVVAHVHVRDLDVHDVAGRAYQLRIHPYRTTDNRIDGVVLVLFDVDDLRRAHLAAQSERDYAHAIVETVQEPLLVLDQNWRIRTANAAFYAMFRVTQAETLGRRLFDLGNGQWNIPELREQLDRLFSGEDDLLSLEVRHDFEPLGPKIMQLCARRVVRQVQGEALVLLAIEDRTRLEMLADELRRHTAELKEADRRKTAFLSMLAHELRNPLAPLQNALHILDQPGVAESTARRMRTIAMRQMRHLKRLVDDLLDVARIERGSIEIRPQNIDLAEVVADSAETMRSQCEGADIQLQVERPADPLQVHGDAARLTQLLINLLHNAAKFTPRGGRIVMKLERDGAQAVVNVVDTGIGIPPEQLPRVFDMFMQGDASSERVVGGLGLGLALVQQLAQAHGGSVSAASEGPGKGSSFEVRLPLAAEARSG